MKPSSLHDRGFTLLEVMIASAIGVIVLTTGLVVGTQMQKRALFEEQTMTAQVTGRAVKEMLTLDVSRAGMGMGNTPISFSDTDERSAITVWHQPDLKTGAGTTLGADPGGYEPPPAGFPVSDALQLYWGDTNGMITLSACQGKDTVRDTTPSIFCARPQASTAMVTPTGPALAVLVSGGNKMACPVSITAVTPGAAGTLSSFTINTALPQSSICSTTPGHWQKSGGDIENWVALRLSGAAYRVNWKGGIPTLEYRAPGTTTWSVLSRDVEQLSVREGVVNLGINQNQLDWYPGENPLSPSTPHPPISDCDVAKYNLGICKTDDKSSSGNTLAAPTTTQEVIKRLRQRVRELEVTLVIRTRRINRDANMTGTDEEGLAKDGYTRRRYTFRVAARNMTVGLTRPPASGTP
ncbi:prepilin-type N-terminal cleavage/methylation domain-containing protein [Corallococcus macrosporus]|uniref:Prepilin-type N-terminal cleavage/methylation domain-containing protein n=1 Tax=Corallococcus macrosporus TaxID=35 RepID=A0ABS3DDX4_9BACT|nr:prepilin-type N-terminal cleavage/methylation domain-containing protein [Corallococcus macrosporus]MBN8229230.1 prepilin-type N-terminal cleavage/methylation domain-containing protein [Corallococcus macrosporus]